MLLLLLALAACDGGTQVVSEFQAAGHAMSPTIDDGENVEVLNYDGASPAYGDIVVFAAPLSPERLFIKRIIGLPGDTVEVKGVSGEVLRNGVGLDEPYAKGDTGCSTTCSWKVPDVQSEISIQYSDAGLQPRLRSTLPADEDEACARSGCYFVLGDNRQNSSDSRQGWLVPAENILGFIRLD